MGMFQFLMVTLVLVLAASLVVKLIHLWAPSAPELISQSIWVLVVVVLVVMLLRAVGILPGHDIPIPKL